MDVCAIIKIEGYPLEGGRGNSVPGTIGNIVPNDVLLATII